MYFLGGLNISPKIIVKDDCFFWENPSTHRWLELSDKDHAVKGVINQNKKFVEWIDDFVFLRSPCIIPFRIDLSITGKNQSP